MPVNVYFLGLVCHINDSDQNDVESFAAVINAPGHRNTIWSYRNGEPDDKRLSHNVEFGRPAGPASTNDDFKELVPNLRDDGLTSGTLRDEARHKRPLLGLVHAYVIYPAGSSLSVAWRYPVKARYENGHGPVCVAQLVRLQINEASVRIPHYNITLDERSPNALIMNASRDHTPSTPHNKHYERILTAGVAGARNVDTSCPVEIEPNVPEWIRTVIRDQTRPQGVPDGHAGAQEESESADDEVLRKEKESIGATYERLATSKTSIRVECANSQWP
jgi:hypothetical protein